PETRSPSPTPETRLPRPTPEPEVPIALPPQPTHDVPSGFIWPSASGRSVLRQLDRDQPARLRSDLAGRHGLADGSGRSDLLLFQLGSFCTKTSPRRRYGDVDEGREALLHLARSKSVLGDLLPRSTTLVLFPDGRGSHWLWTVTPWLETMRSAMAKAIEAADEAALSQQLEGYARAAILSMCVAARRGAVLDVHPSNFAFDGSAIAYLDDDIASGSRMPSIAYAMLQRVQEYAAHSKARESYIVRLQSEIERRLSSSDVRKLDLVAIVEAEPVRSEEAKAARERILGSVLRVSRGSA
ncbi:MAG: hypothetical protein OEY14_15130, partial [Myxococcales bacterium]|nr:hypothetical protein [Myxococcales bacterium]